MYQVPISPAYGLEAAAPDKPHIWLCQWTSEAEWVSDKRLDQLLVTALKEPHPLHLQHPLTQRNMASYHYCRLADVNQN